MPRAFGSRGRRSIRASLSARLPTPAAFATTLILHENFAIGSVTHRAHILKDTTPLATKQGARILLKRRRRLNTVRPGLMTLGLRAGFSLSCNINPMQLNV